MVGRQQYNYLILNTLLKHPTEKVLLNVGLKPYVNLEWFKEDILDCIKNYEHSRWIQLITFMRLNNPLDYDRFNEESEITYKRMLHEIV